MFISIMCVVPFEVKRGDQIPWSWSYKLLWANMWVLEMNSGPLQKQQVFLTTEPSLYPLL